MHQKKFPSISQIARAEGAKLTKIAWGAHFEDGAVPD